MKIFVSVNDGDNHNITYSVVHQHMGEHKSRSHRITKIRNGKRISTCTLSSTDSEIYNHLPIGNYCRIITNFNDFYAKVLYSQTQIERIGSNRYCLRLQVMNSAKHLNKEKIFEYDEDGSVYEPFVTYQIKPWNTPDCVPLKDMDDSSIIKHKLAFKKGDAVIELKDVDNHTDMVIAFMFEDVMHYSSNEVTLKPNEDCKIGVDLYAERSFMG